MSDNPSKSFGNKGDIVHLRPSANNAPKDVTFDRRELDTILRLYSRMVAANEWRDYAIGHGFEKAVFAIFKRANDVPVYTIEKQPSLARRQGAYSVTNASGITLKRGHDLEKVLTVIERKLKLV